jgi:hypothetical protein
VAQSAARRTVERLPEPVAAACAGFTFGAKLGRHQVALDAERSTHELSAWTRKLHAGDDLLRTYWYDGARQGVPTPDQLDIARPAVRKASPRTGQLVRPTEGR